MSTTEVQITVIDPNAAINVVLRQACEGGVRFPDKRSAHLWLKRDDAYSFLFGPKPGMRAEFKTLKRQLHDPNWELGVIMRLNRLWVNAVAWKAMEIAQFNEEERGKLSNALKAGDDSTSRKAALDLIITAVEARSSKLAADHAAREAESVARRQVKLGLIQQILDGVMDGDQRNNLLYSKLNGTKKQQVDTIIAGEGMKIQVGQLRELSELLERLNHTPSLGGGNRRGKGRDPRKAEKSARDKAIRAAMQSPKGQKSALHSVGKK